MFIHREGIPSVFVMLLLGTISYTLVLYLFPSNQTLHSVVIGFFLILLLMVLQFFRNPVRKVQLNSRHILAPADGKVVAIEEVFEEEYLRRPCRQVSIFMSPLNVHVNRNPISGRVSYFQYHPGKYLVAWHPKSSTENERTTIAIRNVEGKEILIRQIAGFLARRIVWYVRKGEQVEQGKEFGFIKFGSRVDVFLPLEAQIQVKIGEKSVGGKTVLATW